MKILKRFLGDERGQDLAEYGIALGVIGALASVFAVTIATSVNSLWSTAETITTTAAS